MARTKNEVLTIRTTTEVKALLKRAAERERRSAASMIEVLVLNYCERNGIRAPDQPDSEKKEELPGGRC